MKQMTQQFLINAFGGESQAGMRYQHFAVLAEKEGYPNTARLWKAVARAEYIHAGDHYKELKHLEGGFVAESMAAFGPGNTEKNLKLSVMGESFEIEEMYPVYVETAKFQGEKGAQRSFEWSLGTEKQHKALFEKALGFVEKKRDAGIGKIQVCEVCGYTLEGEAPGKCPLCGVLGEKFSAFI